MNKKYVVYVHTNINNNKKYVGITSQNINRRWKTDGSGYKKSVKFYNAIKKYGFDAFLHEVVAVGLSKDEACMMEKALIEKFDSYENGYNSTFGGETHKITSEQKKKISESLKKYYSTNESCFKGRKHKQESNIKNRNSHFCKRVGLFSLDGAFIRTYPSIKNAADSLGVSQASIRDCCEGNVKRPRKYLWRYAI